MGPSTKDADHELYDAQKSRGGQSRDMKSSAKVLALTGGGTRGLYSATIISGIEQASQKPAREVFDVFAGTSVGAMLAVGLSLGISANHMAEQILLQAKDIFGHPAWLNPKRLVRAKHDPARLSRAIEAIITPKNMQLRLSDLPVPVVLPAVCLTSNEIVYFTGEPEIGERSCINSTVIDALMSTTAAPTFFPPHTIDGYGYVDGGVGVNSPDVDALYFCRSIWRLPLDHIRLLSIGTGLKAAGATKMGSQNFGAYAWLTNYDIISRMVALQENTATALAQNLLAERYCRVNSRLCHSVEVDDYDQAKLETLISAASKEVADLLDAQPSKLAQFID